MKGRLQSLSLFSVVLLFSSLEFLLAAEINCENDISCKDGEYCHNFGGRSYCTECLDCTLLQRQKIASCPKDFSDCGSCLKGFEEELITQGTSRHKKPCKKSESWHSGQLTECLTDEDCNDLKNQFCFEGRFCASCIDCSMFNRSPNPEKRCPKSVEDCGVCTTGFTSVAVTDGSRQKPCELQNTPLMSHQKTEVHVNVGATSFLASFFVILGFIICVLFFHCLPSSRGDVRVVSSEPPPYQDILPGPSSSSEMVCGFFKEPNEMESTARVFRPPDYERGEASGQSREPERYDVEEDTMPCTWRPCTDEPDGMIETSFTGRICALPESNLPTPTDAGRTTDEPSAKRPRTDLPVHVSQ